MPDPFSILPLPLPIFILNGLEDLGTLHYLLQASPAANIVFAQHYCEITEAILSNFVPELRQLLRVVVSIRSQPGRVRALCGSVQAFDVFRATHIRGSDAGAAVLRKSTTTLAAVRSLAEAASQVQRLSTSFFTSYLKRINSIRPYCSDRCKYWDPRWDRGETEPELVRYRIPKCEEHSWVEEQRVLRALWRVVVYLDVLKLVRPDEGQKGELWDTLATEGPLRLWLHLVGDGKHTRAGKLLWDLQELECVEDFLFELSYPAMDSKCQTPQLQRLPMIEVGPYIPPKPLPSLTITKGLFSDPYGEIERSSRGYSYFCREYHHLYRFALDNLDFKPFQLLGLGVWDHERLEMLGLYPGSNSKVLAENPKHRIMSCQDHTRHWEAAIRWRSLLIPDGGDDSEDR